MRPLYSGLTDIKNSGNTGLWYDKFCDTWQANWEGLGDGGKKNWIDTVTGKPCGDEEQLKQVLERITRLLEHQQQAPLYYKLESDFVTGLGREHPVENGFAWHHTLGTPYLPGSSVKGMVRAWAEVWTESKIEDIRRIFGPSSRDLKENKDLTTNVGSVIFLDALPTKSVQLKADIMTPHYDPYYKDAKVPPADWHGPIPIPFLVVEKDQTFVFGILPRRNDEQSRSDCETVKEWLDNALTWTGAGAKTAVGYGRFVVDTEAQKIVEKRQKEALQEQKEKEVEAKKQAELEKMTPLLREMYTDGYESDSFVGEGMKKWLKRMAEAEGSDNEEVAKHLKAWYFQHRNADWLKPNKKNAEKIALIKKVLGEA